MRAVEWRDVPLVCFKMFKKRFYQAKNFCAGYELLILPIVAMILLIFYLLGRHIFDATATLSFLVQPLVFLLSIFCVALFALKTRQTAQLHEALQLIRSIEEGEKFDKCYAAWIQFKYSKNRDDKFIALFYDFFTSDANSSERNESKSDVIAIMDYFNHFELVCLSMKKGIISEEFYKLWKGRLCLETWNYSISAIGTLRALKNNRCLFIHWEDVTRRWAAEFGQDWKPAAIYSASDLASMRRSAQTQSLAAQSASNAPGAGNRNPWTRNNRFRRSQYHRRAQNGASAGGNASAHSRQQEEGNSCGTHQEPNS